MSLSDRLDQVRGQNNNHNADQGLTCPGCAGRFVSGASWMQHVQRNRCSRIDPSDISTGFDDAIEASVNHLRELILSYDGKPEFLVPSHITDVWGNGSKDEAGVYPFAFSQYAESLQLLTNEEYACGDSKVPDLLTGQTARALDQPPDNASAQKNITAEGHSCDPNDPTFNVAAFKVELLDVYKCPYKNCNSKYKYGKGLIAHLKSTTHTTPKFRCPGCQGQFKSAISWVQHAETVSSENCTIRRTPFYEAVLKQMTAGALTVGSFDTLTMTVKVKIDETWAESNLSRMSSLLDSDEPDRAWYCSPQKEDGLF